MKKIIVAIFAFSVLYMVSCNSGSGSDPKAVLSDFFDAMAKKDIPAVRKLATAESKVSLDQLEAALKMQDTLEDKTKELYDKSKLVFGEPKIEGDKATINVKESKNGNAITYTLKKEAGSWKVALDLDSLMSMGEDAIEESGMTEEEKAQMEAEMEKFRNMSPDSVKMMMEQGKEAMDRGKMMMDSLKDAIRKQ